jgi:hypothetical protein
VANDFTIIKQFDGDFEVVITHPITNGYERVVPNVEDGVKWETDRQGSPGKLTFKCLKETSDAHNFQEGDVVEFVYTPTGGSSVVLFSGYIFTKKRSKDELIEITAYDQLRYFKNKATYVYTNKKASDVVKMIANDFKLKTGTIDSTSYVIGSRVEDNQSLFDIVQNALDLTLMSTNKVYTLYSDQGKIYLRDTNNMKLDLVINESVADNFDYTSSIDDETYNDIELYYDNDETNKREYYHASDSNTMSNWGRLRYTESIKNPANAQDRAKKMLELYNKKTRKLQVKDAFGDYRCRAGASVIVQLDLGDINISNYMLIEKATHTFKKNEYRMDLTLGGLMEFVT